MIRAIITDFDGTLVDTFDANLNAYQKAFARVGLGLSAEQYRACFGLRYDAFMAAVGITSKSIADKIKALKKDYYPQFFDCLKPNVALIELIAAFKAMGGKTAIASTASKENLMNVVNYLGVANHFDLIFAGVDVTQSKPNPEIYLKAIESLGVTSDETIIFEDSDIGVAAAIGCGAKFIRVTNECFK